MIDCIKLCKYSIEELVTQSFGCNCGKTHKLTTEKIFCSFGASARLVECLDDNLPIGRVLVVSSRDIYDEIAKPIIETIKKEGREIEVFLYEKDAEATVRNAALLFSRSTETRLVVSIGSGTVTDLSKYFASVRNIKVIAIATAFSSMAYLTATTEIVVDKRKRVLPTKAVSVLIFDLDIMSNAPRSLLACGVGSVFSNYLTVFDWNVSKKFTDEYFCASIANLLIDSADLMIKGVVELQTNLNSGFTKIANAFLYSCIAYAYIPTESALQGGVRSCANVLMLIQKEDREVLKNQGECEFLMFTKLTLIYKLFFETKLRDNALPPDIDERYSKLVNVLNFRPTVANAMTSTTISPKTYDYIKLKLEEIRDYFIQDIREIESKRDYMISLFKTVYDCDDSDLIFYTTKEDIKNAIVLSTEIEPHFDSLTVMKYLGLLDSFLY